VSVIVTTNHLTSKNFEIEWYGSERSKSPRSCPKMVNGVSASVSGIELWVVSFMSWPPPNFAHLLNCQSLACLSTCASTVKGQQSANVYTLVSKSTYPPIHRSGPEKRIRNESRYSNLFEAFSGQRHEGVLCMARLKDDKKSYLAYPWINTSSVLTFQSPPAAPTLTDKTYKGAVGGTALALRVSTFLFRCSPNSPDYDWSGHYHNYFPAPVVRKHDC
jgi:hypothetical protein